MGTNPPRCSIPSHQVNSKTKPKRKRAGAPKGNKNAEKHGAYSGKLPADLDARIAALDKRLQHVEKYIDIHIDDLEPEEYIKLANLQGQLASRIGRLMRDRNKDDAADEMENDFDTALEIVSRILNIDLTGA
jgi:uncharacterized protein YjcR